MPRILIVAPSWIGDTLLAQPLLARLHAKHAGLVLEALAPAWTKPVLERMPEIAATIVSPFAHGELRLAERWRLGRSLAARGYDEAIVLPNTFKSALVPFFARIPVRTGFVGEARGVLLNRVHRLDRRGLPLMAERYAQLAEAPGEPVHRPLAPARLAVNAANRDAALAHFGLDRSRPVAVFAPGAEYGPAKRWPARHFAALARLLAARGFAVWLVGSPKERALGEEIAAAADGAARNLCGAMDLASAIDVLSVASVAVTNDSGLMHIAAALGLPLVALYGSSSPEHTPPLGPARIARIAIPCSPCFKRECPLGHFRCMNDLAPEQVLAEVERALP
ncbi:MAG: lipopolysaccharide heptosyltransferase II [Burkholderiales bacterium]|nr:lipopolysaccharide heptosyltransferase II [Burkholderiales bacterium]